MGFNHDDERAEMIWGLVTKILISAVVIMICAHLINHFYHG